MPTAVLTSYFAATVYNGSTGQTTAGLGSAGADVIAAALFAGLIPNYLGVTDPGQKTAVLLAASTDVDRSMPFQGRRYDTLYQTNEFPRVAYEPSNALLPNTGAAGIPGGSAWGSTIWNIDPDTLQPVVPPEVLQAVVYQADYLAGGGGSNSRTRDQFQGVKASKAGDLSEEYDLGNEGLRTLICPRAYQLIRRYRLTSGRYL
jgi:hypothetical protein